MKERSQVVARLAAWLVFAVSVAGAGELAPAVDGAAAGPAAVIWRGEAAVGGGGSGGGLDLDDPMAVFGHVFGCLPAEVWITPGENYGYWQMVVGKREIRGNIRVPVARRERGTVAFGYAEWAEARDSSTDGPGLSHGRYFTTDDGVEVVKRDDFTCQVRFRGKEVVFHFGKIDQRPPRAFEMLDGEVFVERTQDESGLRFLLLFNRKQNHFLWVLDEEGAVPERFRKLADDVVAGERTGFVWWLDPQAKPRKVLVAVRASSVTRNDYFDGPFDQLSDNHVASGEVEIRRYMELAMPELRGRIDEYGYYLDTPVPTRVALACYAIYQNQGEVLDFVKRAKQADDPRRVIARGQEAAKGER